MTILIMHTKRLSLTQLMRNVFLIIISSFRIKLEEIAILNDQKYPLRVQIDRDSIERAER